MNHLIGRRRKSGQQVLYAWTWQGIADLVELPPALSPPSPSYDWGPFARWDDCETTAVVMLAFIGSVPQATQAVIKALTREVVTQLPDLWAYSADEIAALVAAIEADFVDLGEPPMPERKRGRAKR